MPSAAAGGDRILEEQLVEVAHPEEHERVGLAALDLKILRHERRGADGEGAAAPGRDTPLSNRQQRRNHDPFTLDSNPRLRLNARLIAQTYLGPRPCLVTTRLTLSP